MRTLHGITPPDSLDTEDDRSNVGAAICARFTDLFRTVLEDDAARAVLPEEDRKHLDPVGERCEAYASLLAKIAPMSDRADAALTHGDLAGDNLMVTQDGRLALIDCGEARISSGLADVAYLSTYASWTDEQMKRFMNAYVDGDQDAIARATPILELLSRLTRYGSCVRSPLWLNAEGPEGLDEAGRAFFERQMRAL